MLSLRQRGEQKRSKSDPPLARRGRSERSTGDGSTGKLLSQRHRRRAGRQRSLSPLQHGGKVELSRFGRKPWRALPHKRSNRSREESSGPHPKGGQPFSRRSETEQRFLHVFVCTLFRGRHRRGRKSRRSERLVPAGR